MRAASRVRVPLRRGVHTMVGPVRSMASGSIRTIALVAPRLVQVTVRSPEEGQVVTGKVVGWEMTGGVGKRTSPMRSVTWGIL
jgi:hypothetical protein